MLLVLVIAGSGPAPSGRNWLCHIRLNHEEIVTTGIYCTSADSLDSLFERYVSVFDDDLGCIHSYHAKLLVRLDAQPKFYLPGLFPLQL